MWWSGLEISVYGECGGADLEISKCGGQVLKYRFIEDRTDSK